LFNLKLVYFFLFRQSWIRLDAASASANAVTVCSVTPVLKASADAASASRPRDCSFFESEIQLLIF
jgi:hypothetical protein